MRHDPDRLAFDREHCCLGDYHTSLPSLLFAWAGGFIRLGVLLFSLTGLPVVGEVVELVRRDRGLAYQSVVIGTLLEALLSWFFGVSWALVLLPATVEGAFFQIPEHLRVVGWLIPLVGFFAIITSHLTTAIDLLAVFHKDFQWRKHYAWVAAVIPPLLLLFILKQDLLHLMDVVGGILAPSMRPLLLDALTLAIRSAQRTNWVIGVRARNWNGLCYDLASKLSTFLLPSSV